MSTARTARSTAAAGAAGTLACAALAAPAQAAHATQASPAQQVIALVNQQRAAHGCAAVASDPALGRAAQDHSTDMAAHDYLGHTGSDGSDPGARMAAAGFRPSSWGEAVAAGQPTSAAVVQAWMNSAEHRAIILNCALHDAGAGYGVNNGTPYHTFWTLDLASR
jgi:uncharacterized protein YkwD